MQCGNCKQCLRVSDRHNNMLMCSESHRIVRADQFCVYETDIARQGFVQLVNDMIHWINKPTKREGQFHFVIALKIVIVTILLTGCAWFVYFMWRLFAGALGGLI